MDWKRLHFSDFKNGIIPKTRIHEATLPLIYFNEPLWFYRCFKDKRFLFDPELQMNAKDIYEKSRNIKVPPSTNGEKREVEYLFDTDEWKINKLVAVPETKPLPPITHVSSTSLHWHREKNINMTFAFNGEAFQDHLETSYIVLCRSLKRILFGTEDITLTKDICESFFDNPDNFVTVDK